MYLRKCPHPGCNEMIATKLKECGNHVKLCVEGCGTPVIGQRKRCEPCKNRVANEMRRQQRKANPDYIARPPEPDPPPPKKVAVYTPPSNEEQRKLDREIQDRLNQRCGYTKDMGRKLSAAEIAKIANQITPIHQIRHKDWAAERVAY